MPTQRTQTFRNKSTPKLNKLIFAAALTLGVYAPVSNAYEYTCGSDEYKCVQNYNKKIISNGGDPKKYNLVRVTMDGKTTPTGGKIRSNANWLANFIKTASQGQLTIKSNGAVVNKKIPAGSNCSYAKSKNTRIPDNGALFTIRQVPQGMCGSSNAGRKYANLKSTLKRDYAHEVGHLLGLKHGNNLNKETETVEYYRDSSTFMGKFPSMNYSAPQLHWLGWTQKKDIVQLNSDVLDTGGTQEITLRPIDLNAKSDSDTPISYVYDLPNEKRLFISLPKSVKTSNKGYQGGTIFFYEAPKCIDCRGMSMSDTVVHRLDVTNINKEHKVMGLIISSISFESETIRVNGKNAEKFGSVTLRVRKSFDTPVNGTRTDEPQYVAIKSALHGKCLDVWNVNGRKRVATYRCHGNNNQKWVYNNESGTITSAWRNASGLCLDASDHNGIYMKKCHGGNNQSFDMLENGSIIDQASKRCLDIKKRNMDNGAKIIPWDCHGKMNQKWITKNVEKP